MCITLFGFVDVCSTITVFPLNFCDLPKLSPELITNAEAYLNTSTRLSEIFKNPLTNSALSINGQGYNNKN
jgi:hypothetical protein